MSKFHLVRASLRGDYRRIEVVEMPSSPVVGLSIDVLSGANAAARSPYRSTQQGIGIHRAAPIHADQAGNGDLAPVRAIQRDRKSMNLCEMFHAAIAGKHVQSNSVAECWESFFSHVKANGPGRPRFDLATLHRAEQLVCEWMQMPRDTSAGAQRHLEIEHELAQIASSLSNRTVVQAGQFWLDEIGARCEVYERQFDEQ